MRISPKKLVVRAAIVLLSVVGLVALAVGGLALWLTSADLKPLLERQASGDLQRPVTIGAVAVDWGDPLAVEFTDLRIANTGWGSVPDMVSVGHMSAQIDVRALLRGELRYERLRIEDATIVLERDPAGVGNWKFPSGGLGGGFAIVPKNRTQFPTLIDFALAGGLVTYRTSSGKILRIALERAVFRTAGEDAPLALQVDLAYNDVPARLDATFESSRAVRDASRPVGAKFTFIGKDAAIAFDGTMTEPVDFEGVRGEMKLEAETLTEILKLFGAEKPANIPLTIAGDFTRGVDDWALSKASGQLAKTAFTGALALHERGRGKPDDITADLDLKPLDLDALMSRIGDGKKAKLEITALPLRQDLAGADLAVKLSSDQVTLAAMQLPSFKVDGRLTGGDVSLRALSFALAGGTLSASGSLRQVEAAGHLALVTHLTKAEAKALAQLLGAKGGEIRGRLDGGATLDVAGKTLGAALKHGRGAAILRMNDGDIARDLIEQVSVDLRNLFREGKGRVPVRCLIGVLTLKDGVGVLSPLRLVSPEATLAGAGTIDFAGKRLDLMLKTESDSTGFFALDSPITVSGPFKDLRVTPLLDADADRLDYIKGDVAVGALPAALNKFADSSDCVE